MSAPALPLSGPPFPHLRSWVAAESFGVRCILREAPHWGVWGSWHPGEAPEAGSRPFLLASSFCVKGSCMG